MSPWALNRRAREIAQGAVFGYPTDTIWGLGCHPLIAPSVARILAIKGRSPDKGLILLSSRLEYCRPYIDADEEVLQPVLTAAEQPTTWLVDASEFCPWWIRGRFPTVAIRITDHPLVREICDRLAAPIVSTSANRSGRSPARNLFQMHREFGDLVDFIVGGYATGGAAASRIKSLADGNIIRSGNP